MTYSSSSRKNSSNHSLYYYSYRPLLLHSMFQWGDNLPKPIVFTPTKSNICHLNLCAFFPTMLHIISFFFLLCLILFWLLDINPGRLHTCVPKQVIHWLMAKPLRQTKTSITPLFIILIVFTKLDLNQQKLGGWLLFIWMRANAKTVDRWKCILTLIWLLYFQCRIVV